MILLLFTRDFYKCAKAFGNFQYMLKDFPAEKLIETVEYMPTDKQYNGQLIDEYHRLEKLYNLAIDEKAIKTARSILEEMKYIKLKLQPVELPDLPILPNE